MWTFKAVVDELGTALEKLMSLGCAVLWLHTHAYEVCVWNGIRIITIMFALSAT